MEHDRVVVLSALIDLLIKIVGQGHVLNSSALFGIPPILVGEMVQVKKKWKWQQIEWNFDLVFEDALGKTCSAMPWLKVLEYEGWGV